MILSLRHHALLLSLSSCPLYCAHQHAHHDETWCSLGPDRTRLSHAQASGQDKSAVRSIQLLLLDLSPTLALLHLICMRPTGWLSKRTSRRKAFATLIPRAGLQGAGAARRIHTPILLHTPSAFDSCRLGHRRRPEKTVRGGTPELGPSWCSLGVSRKRGNLAQT